MDDIESRALTAVVLARVTSLLEQRAWDRRWMRSTWTPARHGRETELRALIKLVRSGRRLARTTAERADPVTQALSWHDWQAQGPQ